MKNLFAFLCLSGLFTACTDSVPSPVIEMAGLYINDNGVDYAQQIEALPLLKVDDEMTISLKLDGRGEDLNTFLVKEDTSEIKKAAVSIDIEQVEEETLSNDKEFTDKKSGKLGFKDGVSQAWVGVRAKVRTITPEGIRLKFYLFSKPADGEGAKYELNIKTTAEEEKENTTD